MATATLVKVMTSLHQTMSTVPAASGSASARPTVEFDGLVEKCFARPYLRLFDVGGQRVHPMDVEAEPLGQADRVPSVAAADVDRNSTWGRVVRSHETIE